MRAELDLKLTGDEQDAFSRRARPMYGWGRGTLKAIKRQYNKRYRSAGKRSTFVPVD